MGIMSSVDSIPAGPVAALSNIFDCVCVSGISFDTFLLSDPLRGPGALGRIRFPHVRSAQYFYQTAACGRALKTKMLSLVLRNIWIVF